LITAHLQSIPLLAERTHRDEAVECAGVDVGGRGVALEHRLVHHTTLGVRSKVKTSTNWQTTTRGERM